MIIELTKDEIKKKFFEAFEIKPNCLYHFLVEGAGSEAQRTITLPDKEILKNFITKCDGKGKVTETMIYYPEITDRLLLELIVINNENAPAVGDTLEELQNQVLYWCTKYKSKIYNKVRELFNSSCR